MSPDLTVVCCIESGPLEHQTVRFVESLRRWGGELRDVPVIAVTPRIGPPLRRATAAALDRNEVEHIRFRSRQHYVWQHYMNKPLALLAAGERASTEQVAWFDSDMLVVRPPDEVLLGPDEDFAACARDKGIGTSGALDPREAYWRHACVTAGLELRDLPMVVTHEERLAIRVYWNSGLFSFRAGSGFAEDYLDLNVALLDSRVGTSSNRLQYNDQVALGLSMVRMGLRWRALGHEYNVGVSRWHAADEPLVEKARIVHYHDSLAGDFFPTFVDQVAAARPDVATWLRGYGPLPAGGGGHGVLRQALRFERSVRRRRFYRECRWV